MIYKSILTHYPLFFFILFFVLFYTHIYIYYLLMFIQIFCLASFDEKTKKSCLFLFLAFEYLRKQISNEKYGTLWHTLFFVFLQFLTDCNNNFLIKYFTYTKLIIICYTFNLHVKQFWLQKWIWRWCGDIIIILMTARKHCT